MENVLNARMLKTRRNALNLTQEEVAKRAGISRATYVKYESGRVSMDNMPYWIVKRLMFSLQMSLNFVADEDADDWSDIDF